MSQKKIQIYYSSVPGSIKVRKDTTRAQDILSIKKIPFELVDVSQGDTDKAYMQEKSGKNVLPQIFVDGEYKGLCEELDEANEFGETHQWLGLS